MRLRTKVSLFSGLIALVATLILTVVTYAFARSALLEQRSELARTQGVSNALRVREHLRQGSQNFGAWFQSSIRPESGGFAAAVLSDEQPANSPSTSSPASPPSASSDTRFSYEDFPEQ